MKIMMMTMVIIVMVMLEIDATSLFGQWALLPILFWDDDLDVEDEDDVEYVEDDDDVEDVEDDDDDDYDNDHHRHGDPLAIFGW